MHKGPRKKLRYVQFIMKDTMTVLIKTLLITPLLIMTILITLNTGDINYSGIT
jgi:hypothetical protein